MAAASVMHSDRIPLKSPGQSASLQRIAASSFHEVRFMLVIAAQEKMEQGERNGIALQDWNWKE